MKLYWDNITAIYEQQRKKGVATYGQTLEDNHQLDVLATIRMAEEEAVDLLMYLEKVKELLLSDRNKTNGDNQ